MTTVPGILVMFLSLILSAASVAFADDAAEEQAEWEPVSAGPLTTWTAPLCGRKKLVAQPFFYYNLTRGSFDNEGKCSGLPDGDSKFQYQEQILIQYGLTDRWEVDYQTVYQQNYRKQGGASANAQGLGDSYLFGRYCFLEEKGALPHITGLLQVKFPTGRYQKLDREKLGTDAMAATSGGGSYESGFGIILTKKLKPLVFHADAIYAFPYATKVDGVKTRYGQYLIYDFGAEYFLPKGFNLLLEFNGFLQGDKRENGEYQPATDQAYFNTCAGVGWSCEKISTLLVYQRTLWGVNADANDSAVFTVVVPF
ncbi:MAG: transporter [Candidatus Omnitrophota bacterium]